MRTALPGETAAEHLRTAVISMQTTMGLMTTTLMLGPQGLQKVPSFQASLTVGKASNKNTHIVNSSGQDISGQIGRGHEGFYEKGQK